MYFNFLSFLFFRYKWWCHFDDDVYVNVRNLLDVLHKHNPSDPVNIGKKSMQYMKVNILSCPTWISPYELFESGKATKQSPRWL